MFPIYFIILIRSSGASSRISMKKRVCREEWSMTSQINYRGNYYRRSIPSSCHSRVIPHIRVICVISVSRLGGNKTWTPNRWIASEFWYKPNPSRAFYPPPPEGREHSLDGLIDLGVTIRHAHDIRNIFIASCYDMRKFFSALSFLVPPLLMFAIHDLT